MRIIILAILFSVVGCRAHVPVPKKPVTKVEKDVVEKAEKKEEPAPVAKKVDVAPKRIVLARVHFPFDSTALIAAEKLQLDVMASNLRAQPGAVVSVDGHTDSRGTRAYNVRLGAKRAVVVSDYLINRGVSVDQLNPRSFGEERPSAIGRSAEAHGDNRRVEFTLVSGAPGLDLHDGVPLDDNGNKF